MQLSIWKYLLMFKNSLNGSLCTLASYWAEDKIRDMALITNFCKHECKYNHSDEKF